MKRNRPDRNRLAVALAAALLPLLLIRGTHGQSGPANETITIDSTAPAHPFPHFWEQMFGSGRAILSLRDSYRKDLRAVRDVTGFRYVRFHAILDDEVGVYDETPQGAPVYNFSYLDQIYDGLLENGVRPFVELSFMPRKLAANLTPHPFWYKPLPSPPRDISRWDALIETLASHLLDRYGRNEIEQWYFEVWNEPNIDFWDGEPKQQTYFALYDQTAQSLKRIDSRIRVGGPATAQSAWVDAFLAHCKEKRIPFDFVSTHIYGNEKPEDVFGHYVEIARRDMVARAAQKVFDQVKALQAPNTPIIWSEYNATYLNQQEVTDSAFMGPWLANNIRECDGLSPIMSYWSFSDVFEEQGVVKTPFYGGYGLIAERGLPKPALRAFELLHRLGEQRLASVSNNALVTQRADKAFALALWNYAEPGENVAPKTFHLELRGIRAKSYRLQFVDPEHASSLLEWKRLGSPISPTPLQISQIQRASVLPPAREHPITDPVTVAPQGLALVELVAER